MPAPNKYYYYEGKQMLITEDPKLCSVYFKDGQVPASFDDKISRYLVRFAPRERMAVFNTPAAVLRKYFSDKRDDLVIHPVYRYKMDKYADHAPLLLNNRLLIKFDPRIKYQEASNFCAQFEAKISQKIEGDSNLFVVEYRGPDRSFLKTVNELYEKNKESVVYAHPDFVNGIRTQAADPDLYLQQQPALAQMNVENAWNNILLSDKPLNPVLVAVLDEGIEAVHPDLAGVMSGVVHDAYAGEDLPYDVYNFHGTALAGIIAGANNQKFVRGVAHNARLMDVRISVTLEGYRESSNVNVVNGIQAAINHKAKIINISWSHPYSSSIVDKINEAISKGIVVCCAAGNFYPGESNGVIFPAVLAQDPGSAVIAVAACNGLNQLVELADGYGFGSRRGPAVTLLAPGHKVVTLQMASPKYLTNFKGSSASTAFVSGIAALLTGVDGTLTPMQVKTMLASHAGPNSLADAGSASADAVS